MWPNVGHVSEDRGRINCRWPVWFSVCAQKTELLWSKGCRETDCRLGLYTSVHYRLHGFENWIKWYAWWANRLNHMHAWSYCSYTHTWTCTTYMYVFSGRTPHPFEQRKVVFHVFRHGLNLFAFKFAALSIEKKQRKSLKLDKNDDKLFISLHGKRKVWWKCFLVNKIYITY